jgi:hypothetical protein
MIGLLIGTDPDGDPVTVNLVNAEDNAIFLGGGPPNSRPLAWNISPNYEKKKTYTITATATDGKVTVQRTFTIRVTDVNEAPYDLTISNSSTKENVPVGTVIGTLKAKDEDANDTLTYSIVGGRDRFDFALEGDQLKWARMPDYEENFGTKKKRYVRVRATDRGGLYTEKDLVISIENVNEPPSRMEFRQTSHESGVSVGSVVGEFSSWDYDLNDSHTFSLVGDALDNNKFTISGNKLKWAVRPTRGEYRIKVRVKDKGGLYLDGEFTIVVR